MAQITVISREDSTNSMTFVISNTARGLKRNLMFSSSSDAWKCRQNHFPRINKNYFRVDSSQCRSESGDWRFSTV